MSRDALLYIADIVAAGESVLRYTDAVTFETFAGNHEKRAAVERQVFVIGEAGGSAAGGVEAASRHFTGTSTMANPLIQRTDHR